jgi:hypothetical protein
MTVLNTITVFNEVLGLVHENGSYTQQQFFGNPKILTQPME